MSIAVSRSPRSSFRLPRARILRFAILLFQYFYPRRKRIYIAAVVSPSGLPGGNARLSYCTAGVFDPPHSHAGYPTINALRERENVKFTA